MTVSSQESALAGLAGKFGLGEGLVVQELGFDTDCDQTVSDAIASVAELVDETYDDVIDAVLLWWRDDDGDLVDALVDALGPLADSGVILGPTTLVIQMVKMSPSEYADKFGGVTPLSETVGTGKAYVLRDGEVFTTTWNRAFPDSGTTFTS